MAAYGAAISLRDTIQTILQSSRITLAPPSPQILQPAYDAMVDLQKALLKLDETSCSKIRTKVNALDERIKEAVWEFEDLLESHVYQQILPQLEGHYSFSVDLLSLRQSVDCFIQRVAVMEAEFDTELLNMPEEEGEPLSSRIDFHGIDSNMVGLSQEFENLRDYLLHKMEGKYFEITGMAGVGKTTFAKKLFDDPSLKSHFELRVWVKVGRKCECNEILRCILAQVDRDQKLTQGDEDGDKKLVGLLEERLKDKKCFIVLDDVWKWDAQVMDNLSQDNVRILITSRENLEECQIGCTLRLLNEEESKKLLGKKVFGEDGFPPHLDELGEKIAKKCEGLPLMIVIVAEFLSKEETTKEYWTEVTERQHNSVFVDAYDNIAEVLFPSYDYLPQKLKMLFLYLGAYPAYTNIHPHIILNQLSTEGFLESFGKQILGDILDGETFDYLLRECLAHLASRKCEGKSCQIARYDLFQLY
ncbi:putative late blight resistance protein homolog R1A-10 isoform X3 [Salvia hispanica]|uniref:putative late blight resistance protein homolog R1A-10 isoform X3 n=1 Tax=Salvia hispanica TaxID=49212 RepID=UPI0020094F14|nr:putative late blight resistance protein homolog R1A-10 isoform X3 [Salvia hispanica]